MDFALGKLLKWMRYPQPSSRPISFPFTCINPDSPQNRGLFTILNHQLKSLRQLGQHDCALGSRTDGWFAMQQLSPWWFGVAQRTHKTRLAAQAFRAPSPNHNGAAHLDRRMR